MNDAAGRGRPDRFTDHITDHITDRFTDRFTKGAGRTGGNEGEGRGPTSRCPQLNISAKVEPISGPSSDRRPRAHRLGEAPPATGTTTARS
ncbi:hypothetical protein [Streptomyces griseus]|uniref:hypothetical protein n=1 Tax=Streptomyces griseus TaxID=1911 RepID=UPI0037FB88AE